MFRPFIFSVTIVAMFCNFPYYICFFPSIFFYFHFCMCLYVWHICMCICVYVCICVWKPEVELGYFSQFLFTSFFFFLFLRQSLSLTLVLTVHLGWLVRELQWYASVSARVTDVCCHTQTFTRVLGNWSQALVYSLCLGFLFCTMIKIPWQNQFKGEKVYLAYNSRLRPSLHRI